MNIVEVEFSVLHFIRSWHAVYDFDYNYIETDKTIKIDRSVIFETRRLVIRTLNAGDKDLFYEMLSNPNVMNPIPQEVFTRSESDAKLAELISQERSTEIRLWCLTEKGTDSLIGIAGFLRNGDEEDEIAYRLIERYWGRGYGTEIAKGLIDYAFKVLDLEKITADVNVANLKSARILEKFMIPVREFFNEEDNCTDRRYYLMKEDYISKE